MIEMAVLVAAGLIVLWMKMPWKWKLRMLSNPLTIDVIVFIGLTLIHWGSFSGVMIASVAAFLVSVCLSFGRWLFGHYKKGNYVRGRINIDNKLNT